MRRPSLRTRPAPITAAMVADKVRRLPRRHRSRAASTFVGQPRVANGAPAFARPIARPEIFRLRKRPVPAALAFSIAGRPRRHHLAAALIAAGPRFAKNVIALTSRQLAKPSVARTSSVPAQRRVPDRSRRIDGGPCDAPSLVLAGKAGPPTMPLRR